MPWNDTYATGHPDIDRQHRVLFGMIDRIARDPGIDYEDQVQIVLDLIKYVVQHFGVEERLMEEYGYPDAAGHRHAHARLSETVMRLRDGLLTGLIEQTEIQRFFDDWLRHHIGENDRQLAVYLAKMATSS